MPMRPPSGGRFSRPRSRLRLVARHRIRFHIDKRARCRTIPGIRTNVVGPSDVRNSISTRSPTGKWATVNTPIPPSLILMPTASSVLDLVITRTDVLSNWRLRCRRSRRDMNLRNIGTTFGVITVAQNRRRSEITKGLGFLRCFHVPLCVSVSSVVKMFVQKSHCPLRAAYTSRTNSSAFTRPLPHFASNSAAGC